MTQRLDYLEQTLLDLGTQIFYMKQEIQSLKSYGHHTHIFLGKIKKILEEKGMIDVEEFADMNEGIIDETDHSNNPSFAFEHSLDRIKKTSH
jgi:hypothetical protein